MLGDPTVPSCSPNPKQNCQWKNPAEEIILCKKMLSHEMNKYHKETKSEHFVYLGAKSLDSDIFGGDTKMRPNKMLLTVLKSILSAHAFWFLYRFVFCIDIVWPSFEKQLLAINFIHLNLKKEKSTTKEQRNNGNSCYLFFNLPLNFLLRNTKIIECRDWILLQPDITGCRKITLSL